jgi:CheY-specific phosphatase CheX
MDNAGIQYALEQSATEVLEQMFFINPLVQTPQDAAPAADALLVQIAFDGDPPGRLCMHLPYEAAANIAANFLGADPEAVSRGQISEVAGELANMICGAVLSRTESTAAFRLASPRVWLSASDETSSRSSGSAATATTQTCTLDTGYGFLTATLETESLLCPASAKLAF